jgi:putative transposase
LPWIQPGKPTQNAYIERINGSFRRELLAAQLVRSPALGRQLVDDWIFSYNTQRPYHALNFMTPLEFKQAAQLLAYRMGKRTHAHSREGNLFMH